VLQNLGAEYQKIQKALAASGVGTDIATPLLRGSADVFTTFDEYYRLYYPHGGSTRPLFVLTESSLTDFRK
jgi:hypothetical protein